MFIDELLVIKSDYHLVSLDISLDQIIQNLSSRDAVFFSMTSNEKLRTIWDTFEYIGKVDGKYKQIPYQSITLGYPEDSRVKEFADELQNFRHGEKGMVAKRNTYSKQDKLFLINFGLTILNTAFSFLKSKATDSD